MRSRLHQPVSVAEFRFECAIRAHPTLGFDVLRTDMHGVWVVILCDDHSDGTRHVCVEQLHCCLRL